MANLQNGSRGSAVLDLQKQLNAVGSGIAEDGIFGTETEGAVRDFQKSAGLADDGIAGPDTMGVLAAHVAQSQNSSRYASDEMLTFPETEESGVSPLAIGAGLLGLGALGMTLFGGKKKGGRKSPRNRTTVSRRHRTA